jgi:uncharacterized protein (DUF1697 family)
MILISKSMMATYISILRGINVSGQKVIKMDVLKVLYEDLNFKNVKTYIQSGNIVFQYTSTAHTELEQLISRKINQQFGFDVSVMVMNIEKLTRIISNNPFIKDETKDISHLHVTFLSSVIEKVDKEIINQYKSAGEEFLISDDVIYLYCPNGYGKTKLSNTFFEKKLKVGATTRNWKTTNELLKIAIG